MHFVLGGGGGKRGQQPVVQTVGMWRRLTGSQVGDVAVML